jgi:protein O-mannosyl-transferase
MRPIDSLSRHRTLAIIIALIALVAIIYSPTARYPYVNYDDDAYVYDNRHVTTGLTWPNIVWDFGIHPDSMGDYSPLVFLSHQIDVSLFGVQPAGPHHLVNVALHATAAVLLFVLLSRMTATTWTAAWVACLFAIHPIHVQSVAWVTERKDCLCAVFWMAALLAYERYVRAPRPRRYLLIMLWMTCALLAKPLAVTLPCVMLLLDYWPLARLRQNVRRCIIEKLPLLGLSILDCIMTVIGQQLAQAMVGAYSRQQRIENSIISYAVYLRKAIWPSDLAVFYQFPSEIPISRVVLCATILLAITAGCIILSRRRPYLIVGWLWYLGTMLPMIGIVQVGAQALADRYAYIPLIGVYLMVAFAACDLATRRATPTFPKAPAIIACILIAALTIRASIEVRHWSSGEALFRHAIAVTNKNYIAHNNLGTALLTQGNRPAALAEFERALRDSPDNIEAINNIAMYLAADGQLDQALAMLRRSAAISPHHAPTRYNLGVVLLQLNRPAEAETELRAAIQADPNREPAYYNLGISLMRQGRASEAIAPLETAVALKPSAADAWNNLGICYAAAARTTDAATAYEQSLRADPNFAPARTNLQRLGGEQGN